jgi:hypothetical protein
VVGYRRRNFAWVLLVRCCLPLVGADKFANAICRLKCDDFADAYLCNANGSFVDGNATFTKPKQHDRAHTLTWTLRDADAAGYDAKGWRISVLTDENLASTTLSEREQALTEKKNELLEKEQLFAEKQQIKHDEFTTREANCAAETSGRAGDQRDRAEQTSRDQQGHRYPQSGK